MIESPAPRRLEDTIQDAPNLGFRGAINPILKYNLMLMAFPRREDAD